MPTEMKYKSKWMIIHIRLSKEKQMSSKQDGTLKSAFDAAGIPTHVVRNGAMSYNEIEVRLDSYDMEHYSARSHSPRKGEPFLCVTARNEVFYAIYQGKMSIPPTARRIVQLNGYCKEWNDWSDNTTINVAGDMIVGDSVGGDHVDGDVIIIGNIDPGTTGVAIGRGATAVHIEQTSISQRW